MHIGLCTLIGVRKKPDGREKANRGKKESEGRKGEEEKEKRKRKEEKRRCVRPVQLRVCANIKIARASLFQRGNLLLCTK
jgi:hypothetical protein